MKEEIDWKKELLESGIGHGYHVIHKMRGKVLSKKMDEYVRNGNLLERIR